MLTRFSAFFLAVYLFFAGLIYGNGPIQIEITESAFDSGVVVCSPGSRCALGFTCKNVGRPFQGKSNVSPNVSIYREVGNERSCLRLESFLVAESTSQPVLIKHNAVFSGGISFELSKEAPEGVYSVSVQFYNAEETIFKDVFIVQ